LRALEASANGKDHKKLFELIFNTKEPLSNLTSDSHCVEPDLMEEEKKKENLRHILEKEGR